MAEVVRTGGVRLGQLMRAAWTERIDLAVLGDSNSFWGASSGNGGYGMMKGLSYAAASASRYGLYASPVIPGCPFAGPWEDANPASSSVEKGMVPGGSNTRIASSGSSRLFNEGAPATMHAFAIPPKAGNRANDGRATPWGYFYLVDSAKINAPNFGRGPRWWHPDNTTKTGLLNIEHNLTYHLRYGTFASGSGSFRVQAKSHTGVDSNGQGQVYASSATINPVTGTDGLADLSLAIPAGTRDSEGMWIRPVSTWGSTKGSDVRADLWGPFFALHQRLVDGDQTTGIGVNLLGHFGGETSYDAAVYFADYGGTIAAGGYDQRQAQQEHWRFLLSTQRAAISDAKLIIPMFFAQNDINGNSTANSIGPNPSPSNTKQGYSDNHRALITQIRADLTAVGADLDNVCFVIGPYNRNPGQSEATREAWVDQLATDFDADDGVAVLDGAAMMTDSAIVAHGGYDPLSAHLEPESYTLFGEGFLAVAESQPGTEPVTTPQLFRNPLFAS